MIMFEQSRRLSRPLRWDRREKTIVGILAVCVVLALMGGGAYAIWGESSSGKDCISVTFASTLGGAQLHACGAQARNICAQPASYRSIGPDLAVACRHAGYPFGRR